MDQRRISPLKAAFNCAQCPLAYFRCYATVGQQRRASRQHVARMLWICVVPGVTKPVANYAPRVNQRRSGSHWTEDNGPNLACRAVAPPQVCGPQAQERPRRWQTRNLRRSVSCTPTHVRPAVGHLLAIIEHSSCLRCSFICVDRTVQLPQPVMVDLLSSFFVYPSVT